MNDARLVPARLALSCLDLTSLSASDTEADIVALCQRAQSPWGAVAAVCVWPRLVACARQHLPSHIAVAAVANFPHGNADVAAAVRETQIIVNHGAQEVDVVLPYRSMLAGDVGGAEQLLTAVRAACPGLLLKVILETGELGRADLIAEAARVSLHAGANFLKTSTGKTPVGATPDAARAMLAEIRAHGCSAGGAGLKVSGGVRTVADAEVYMRCVSDFLGAQALHPSRFRIGASSLLDAIEATLHGRGASSERHHGGY